VQYGLWLWHVLHGDLGWSFATGRPALDTLVSKLGNTLVLAAASLVIAVVLGVLFGVLAALRPYSAFDRAAVAIAVVLGNAPPFWLGLVLIYVFSLELNLFPSQGMQDLRGQGGVLDMLKHLVLPAITTAVAPGAICAVAGRRNGRTRRPRPIRLTAAARPPIFRPGAAYLSSHDRRRQP
jgi:peptide/nickel transport system permease protein